MRRPWQRRLDWTLKRGSQNDVEQALRDQSALGQLPLDLWPEALARA
jgi:hypothetical protein